MVCSSFHGVIKEIPGVYCDNFENPEETNARAYFLSHCHTDHTRGLFSKELLDVLEQNGTFIYMSEMTYSVICHEYAVKMGDELDRLVKFMRALKLGTNYVTLPSIPERNLDELIPTVTLIPAGHCLGSVMFLFQTNKTILFTGDFRISSNDISKYNHLERDGMNIHKLYIDTTFIHKSYKNFPKRSDSLEAVIEEIRTWFNASKENKVAIHTSAKYGYEYVFNKIYEKLGLKTYVNDERWSFYKTVSDKIPGVTNEPTKIHICRNRNENYNHNYCVPYNGDKTIFLFIHFSAMLWSDCESDIDFYKKTNNRINICFPTHCSRSEMIYFVNYLNPRDIEGFPHDYNVDRNVDRFEYGGHFETPKKIKMASPKIEKQKTPVNKMFLRKMFED